MANLYLKAIPLAAFTIAVLLFSFEITDNFSPFHILIFVAILLHYVYAILFIPAGASQAEVGFIPGLAALPRFERDISGQLERQTQNGLVTIRAFFVDFVNDVSDIDTEGQYSHGPFPKSWMDLGDIKEILEMLHSSSVNPLAHVPMKGLFSSLENMLPQTNNEPTLFHLLKKAYSQPDDKPDLSYRSEVYNKYGPIIKEMKTSTYGNRLFKTDVFGEFGLGPRNTQEGDMILFAHRYSMLLIVRPMSLKDTRKLGIKAEHHLIGACYVGNDSYWSKTYHDLDFQSPKDWTLWSEILNERTDKDNDGNKRSSHVAKQGSPTVLQRKDSYGQAVGDSIISSMQAYPDIENTQTADTTGTRYIMFWQCTCGHQGFDEYSEQRPGAMLELLEVFRKHRIKASLKAYDASQPIPALMSIVRLYTSIVNLAPLFRSYLPERLQNKELASPVATRHGHKPNTVNDRNLSSKTAAPPTNAASSSGQNTNTNLLGSNQQAQVSTGAATGTSATPSQLNQPSPSSAVQIQVNTANINIREDFILLCMKVKMFLTNRHDIQVSSMTCDRELFEAFRQEYMSKFGWVHYWLSFRTIKKINFVKFDLHPRYEVDGIMDGMPPDTVRHYTCDPRDPARVPPLGSDFLMHRFSSPTHCFDDDICLRQFPKRVGNRPIPGKDPDFNTAWGIHLKQDIDWRYFWLFVFFTLVLGSVIGLIVGIITKSVQNGTSIGGYVASVVAVAVATVQVLLTLGTM